MGTGRLPCFREHCCALAVTRLSADAASLLPRPYETRLYPDITGIPTRPCISMTPHPKSSPLPEIPLSSLPKETRSKALPENVPLAFCRRQVLGLSPSYSFSSTPASHPTQASPQQNRHRGHWKTSSGLEAHKAPSQILGKLSQGHRVESLPGLQCKLRASLGNLLTLSQNLKQKQKPGGVAQW